MYLFQPNEFGKKFFQLTSTTYGPHKSMTDLIELAIGKDNYDRYMVAQDLIPKGKSKGEIAIIVNPDEEFSALWVFSSIGEMVMLDQDQINQINIDWAKASQAIANALKPVTDALNHFVQVVQELTTDFEPPDPEWWPLHITAEGGGFGRFRWSNADHFVGFWGECWWDYAQEGGEW